MTPGNGRAIFAAAMSTVAAWIASALFKGYLWPSLRGATPRDRWQHVSLILGLVLTVVAVIVSLRAGEIRAIAQSPSMRDTIENKFAIESLKEAVTSARDDSRRQRDDLARIFDAQNATISKMSEKIGKLERDNSSMSGGLKVLAWLISVCGGLQIFQILNYRKTKGGSG